jgi:glycerol-3-phosphate acyltransferase PlsX
MPELLESAKTVDPDYVGGAILLGVAGIAVVAHGSSSALAIVSAVRQAIKCVDAQIVERTEEAVRSAG